jgi:cytochrome c biogenesis protein CcmG/thiol:disulfide interchange protein DsbE
MEPAPLPPDSRRSTIRRYGPLTLAGLVVIGLLVAVLVSFTGGSSSNNDADVVKLDPDATQPFNGVEGSTDPSGQKLGNLTYTTFDGETKSLKPDGKPLLINIWSSTCTPCITEMPALEKVWLVDGERIDILGLDYYESPDLGQVMADRTGVTYPLGRDTKGTILRTLGGAGLPYTVLVGEDGTILATHAGALTEAQFRDLVDTAAGN